MSRVGFELVDLVEKILLKEELANVLDCALGETCTVGNVRLDSDVDVRGAGDVIAREKGQELDHSLRVRDLNSAQERIVIRGTIITG